MTTSKVWLAIIAATLLIPGIPTIFPPTKGKDRWPFAEPPKKR